MTPLARAEGLSHVFASKTGSTKALDAITAEIAPGVITGVVGPDGAGKTTFLRHLAGLLRPSAGRVEVLGHDMANDAAAAHPFIGYMPQRFGLYEDLSVAENLALFADLHGLRDAAREERAKLLLEFTGLAPFTARQAGALSGGMKQKLGLACALLARPKLLLLDEPSVGVDPASRRELWRIVERMMGEAKTAGTEMGVVWATSYLDEAERCASVLLLHEGKLLSAAPPADFLAPMAGRVCRVTLPAAQRRRAVAIAKSLPGVLDALVQGDSLRLVLAPGAAPPDAALLGGSETKLVPPRFEDGFMDRLIAAAPPQKTAPPPPVASFADGAVIEVNHLIRRFGEFVAVNDVSFTIARGEIFGLLGPNGAGKSTTFRMLCGLLRPSSGSALVAGENLLAAAAQARAKLGYMAQKFSLYGELTVRQNLDFFARAYGLDRAARRLAIADALARFELAEAADSLASALPLGLKQRLSLAAALMHKPEILFLDEPTSGVDPLNRRAFWARIGELAAQGVTVLVTSHFMDEAEYCDRLAIINAGRVLVTDTPAALRARVRTPALPDPTLEDAFIALVEGAAA
ncbi:ATP-binding cassette domain-containing protein [Acidocella aromatica]|uniref:ABC-2 type transport system ATP-binding protein n=1 Tax=Acidocella aromatica TaxID=1303579 RepID=A0A840VEY9_9PROT|nr:ATP-binding cassette domain-containing protein [Acidocella aromatica]MBB5374398.1 ABC-2 type transport system ATP-binding protein [Acidocella aromatica]